MALGKVKITCIGSALIDIMYTIRSCQLIDDPDRGKGFQRLAFEFGAKYQSDSAKVCLGGGALNTAATFHSLGVSPAVIASVGNDAEGRDIERRLRRLKIPARLQYSQTKGTGLSFVINCDRRIEHVVFTYSGARSELNLSVGEVGKIKSPWIYLSGLSGPNWEKNVDRVFRRAAAGGSKVAWNPGADQIAAGGPALKKYFAQTEVLLLNLAEATQLLGAKKQQSDLRQLIRSLHQFGQSISVITQGKQGAYVYDGKKLLFKSALKKKITVNTTGAGDAFGAGFVAGLLTYNGNLSRSLSLGIYNSGHVVQKNGAQAGILTKQQVKRLNI